MENIVVAVISGLCVAIPNLIATKQQNDKHATLMQYKVDDLTKKVEKHNQVVERMALAEQSIKGLWKNVDEIKEIERSEHR